MVYTKVKRRFLGRFRKPKLEQAINYLTVSEDFKIDGYYVDGYIVWFSNGRKFLSMNTKTNFDSVKYLMRKR